MKNFFRTVFILSILLTTACTQKVTKIACVGDSITEGYGLACQSKTAYPVVLDSILGAQYAVMNLGRSATTLSTKGDFPYWICKEFSETL